MLQEYQSSKEAIDVPPSACMPAAAAMCIQRKESPYVGEPPSRVAASLSGIAELYNDDLSPLTIGYVTEPWRQRHSYRWIIRSGSVSHTAFHTDQGLQRWIRDSGMVLPCAIAEIAERGIVRPSGLLVQNLTYDMAGCLRLEAEGRAYRRTLFDNGDLTDAWVEIEADRRVWHVINCNVRGRPRYDHMGCPYARE